MTVQIASMSNLKKWGVWGVIAAAILRISQGIEKLKSVHDAKGIADAFAIWCRETWANHSWLDIFIFSLAAVSFAAVTAEIWSPLARRMLGITKRYSWTKTEELRAVVKEVEENVFSWGGLDNDKTQILIKKFHSVSRDFDAAKELKPELAEIYDKAMRVFAINSLIERSPPPHDGIDWQLHTNLKNDVAAAIGRVLMATNWVALEDDRRG
jgi:hypothetical protein